MRSSAHQVAATLVGLNFDIWPSSTKAPKPRSIELRLSWDLAILPSERTVINNVHFDIIIIASDLAVVSLTTFPTIRALAHQSLRSAAI